jgi:hypothetical protein
MYPLHRPQRKQSSNSWNGVFTKALPGTAAEVFTATLCSNQRGAARHGTLKTPLSLLLPCVYLVAKCLTVSYLATL